MKKFFLLMMMVSIPMQPSVAAEKSNSDDSKTFLKMTNVKLKNTFYTKRHTNSVKLGFGFRSDALGVGGLYDTYFNPGAKDNSFQRLKMENSALELWKTKLIPNIGSVSFTPGVVISTSSAGSNMGYYLVAASSLPADFYTSIKFQYAQNNYETKNYHGVYDEKRNWLIEYNLIKNFDDGSFIQFKPEYIINQNEYKAVNNKKKILYVTLAYEHVLTDKWAVQPGVTYRNRNYNYGNGNEYSLFVQGKYKF
ncbi:oligogalacturonate-specific porin KdgM family protein [Pectobacterium brasiliense]|uniref:oligogalacturonate-specific porin KdgM family protein n=1 Tax=Pectobacterium brasiliense TaxID=180957 RepID=UPI0032EC1C4E